MSYRFIIVLLMGVMSLRAEELVTKEFKFPSDMFLYAGKDGEPPIPHGGVKEVKLADAPFPVRLYDVSDWFKNQGITFPAGSYAKYVDEAQTVVIQSTAENLALVDKLIDCGGTALDTRVRSRLILAIFRLGRNELPDPSSTYEDLRKKADSFWRELSVIEVLGMSGQWQQASAFQGKGTVNFGIGDKIALPQLSTDADGAACALVPVVGPSGSTISVDIAYRFQGMLSPSGSVVKVQFEGSANTTKDQPEILQIGKMGELSYALVLLSTVRHKPLQ